MECARKSGCKWRMVCLISVPDHLALSEFHNIMRAILGWHGDLGYCSFASGCLMFPRKSSGAMPIGITLQTHLAPPYLETVQRAFNL